MTQVGGIVFHEYGAVVMFRGACVMMALSLAIFLLTHKPLPENEIKEIYQIVTEEVTEFEMNETGQIEMEDDQVEEELENEQTNSKQD